MAVDNVTDLSSVRQVTSSIPEDDIADIQMGEIPEDGLEIEVDLDDGAVSLFSDEEDEVELPHNANLAEYIDLQVLDAFGSDLIVAVDTDEESRSDWKDVFKEGLKLMGINGSEQQDSQDYEEIFKGASRLFLPVITEACVQFQSEALKAMLPPHGPVDTKVIGDETPEKQAQARRIKGFMNYLVMDDIDDYFEEHDKLLAYLGKSGSAFKKCYFNMTTNKLEVIYLPAENVVVPYNATSLSKSPRVTHIENISQNDLDHRMAAGLYREVEVVPMVKKIDEVEDELKKQQGLTQLCMEPADEYEMLEIHVETVVPGFESDRGGLSAPYIVHIDRTSGTVMGIYRNWREQDPVFKKEAYFVHYPLVQSDGFYGYGFIHLLGQLARAATAAMRQMLDAGTLANLQGGFKRKGTRMAKDGEPFEPGEFRDVETFTERLQDSIMQLKFNEPSNVLYQLMGWMVDTARRMVSLTDLNVGDGNQEAPVGTTIALLERGMNVMSAVHMRLCRAMKQEFKIIARLSAQHLPERYPYDVPGETREVFQEDFDDRVDVLPVCDPRQFSQAMRIARAQNKLQLASQAPQYFDQREAYRDMMAEIDDSNLDRIMPPPQDAKPTDPMTENMDAITGKPLKAFMEQNHDAHIGAHMAQMQNPQFQENPKLLQALQAHIQEHMAMKYRMDMMAAMGIQDPAQLEQLPPEQLAVMAAQATQQVTGQAQAMAEAEARAQEPTLEQQALMQEQANDQAEIQRKATKDQMDFMLQQRELQQDREIDTAKIKQDDRQAEMQSAAQILQMNQQERQDMRGRFIDLVTALQNVNQQEQRRDANTEVA